MADSGIMSNAGTTAGAEVAAPTPLLIIDDDRELCELLREYLRSTGFAADAVNTPAPGVLKALSGAYAAVVLDVMLPGMDGFEALRQIRAQSRIPVLMLTARGDEVDRVVGLEVGADDYLPKPFSPRELVARLRAILRRAHADTSGRADRMRTITVGDVHLNLATRTVQCAGAPVELTGMEFALLELLMRGAGHVVSREELSQSVLGRPLFPEDRTIDVHISHLRRKLRSDAGEKIRTMRGTGYMFLAVPGPDSAAALGSGATRS